MCVNVAITSFSILLETVCLMPKFTFYIDLTDERQYKIDTDQGKKVFSKGEFLSPVRDHENDLENMMWLVKIEKVREGMYHPSFIWTIPLTLSKHSIFRTRKPWL